MGSANPVQECVNCRVFQLVVDLASDPGCRDPALLAQDAEGLGYRVLGSADGGGQVTDANARDPVQAEQYLEAIRIREQIEALRPPFGVHIGERRHHLMAVIPGLRHPRNLTQIESGSPAGQASQFGEPG